MYKERRKKGKLYNLQKERNKCKRTMGLKNGLLLNGLNSHIFELEILVNIGLQRNVHMPIMYEQKLLACIASMRP